MSPEITEPQLIVRRELFGPHELLRAIVQETRPAIDNRGLSLKVMMEEELQINVIGDPNILRKIINELLNYLLANMPTGEIEIMMDTQLYKPNGLLLMSEGPEWSVLEEDLLSLFSGTHTTLTQAKQLVHQLGGTITAENEIGRCTTFVVIIPVEYLPETQNMHSDAIH